MPQLQQLNSTKRLRKPAKSPLVRLFAAAALCAAAAFGPVVHAAAATATTAIAFNQSLFFVLDGTISSRTPAGTQVRAHLRDAVVASGKTIAAAGTPVRIVITHSSGAQVGNIDGSADIFFDSLPIAGGKTLPLITPTSHLDPHTSAGAESTQAVTDTVGDIFIPYHYLYHILRKGSDVTLKPGAVIRARAGATVTLDGDAVSVTAPPTLIRSADTPHPAFVPAPLETPPGYVPPTPKPTPSARPTPAPGATP